MTKHIYTFVALIMLAVFTANAQTVSDFENITIPTSGYLNGSDASKKLESGNIILRNNYDTAWGGSWYGFAVSNKVDTITAGYFNQYSAIAGKGYNSANYAVGYSYSVVVLKNQAAGKEAKGFWVTNNTYAYLSMKNGDSTFAKKFGGVSGNDTDWFKITISGYLNNSSAGKMKDFYLADYQNKDNSKDYIIKGWTWVDLTSLGNVDSLTFMFSSTDTGQYGMNTPGYFCMDNFTTSDHYTGLQNISSSKEIFVYPCPANEVLYTSESLNGKRVSIYDMQGHKVYNNLSASNNNIDITSLAQGMYLLQILDGTEVLQTKFVKQ